MTPLNSKPDFLYLKLVKGLFGFAFCFLAGFCRVNTTGSVSALSHGDILEETRAKSMVLSVFPCRDPRRVGNRVVTVVT